MPKINQLILMDTELNKSIVLEIDEFIPDENLEILISKSRTTAYLGESINITCFVETVINIAPQRQLSNQWTYPDSFNYESIDQSEISTASNLNTTLMIKQVEFYNRGVYECLSRLLICGRFFTARYKLQLIVQSN